MHCLIYALLLAAPTEAEVSVAVSASNLSLATTAKIRRGVNSGFEAKLEWNPWISVAGFDAFQPGALNLGAGWYRRYFMNRARFAVSAGPSMLLFDTPIDSKGTVGAFLSFEPVLLSWPLRRGTLTVDPGSIHLVMPVLSGIPLIHRQYRHGIGYAYSW